MFGNTQRYVLSIPKLTFIFQSPYIFSYILIDSNKFLSSNFIVSLEFVQKKKKKKNYIAPTMKNKEKKST